MFYTFNNRTGEIAYNFYGSKMIIKEYHNALNIVVEFENGYTKKTNYNNFKTGIVKSPYDKSVYGIGYLGEGKYEASINKRPTKAYDVWIAMIRGCYNQKTLNMIPSYINCTVCEEWHNFQNFSEWFYKNYYEVNDERIDLDKDILFKGNKVYSPNTCIFVPKAINNLFTKRQNHRGDYPIGVKKEGSRYRIDINCYDFDTKKNFKKYIGHCKTLEESFNLYKIEKEKIIKDIANKYKNYIPKKLYKAMYNYKVEIID
jgi:hypothetical protein